MKFQIFHVFLSLQPTLCSPDTTIQPQQSSSFNVCFSLITDPPGELYSIVNILWLYHNHLQNNVSLFTSFCSSLSFNHVVKSQVSCIRSGIMLIYSASFRKRKKNLILFKLVDWLSVEKLCYVIWENHPTLVLQMSCLNSI